MLTIAKVFIILRYSYPASENRKKTWEFSKQISKSSFQLSFQIYFLLVQTEREIKTFSGRVEEEVPHCEIILNSTWLS